MFLGFSLNHVVLRQLSKFRSCIFNADLYLPSHISNKVEMFTCNGQVHTETNGASIVKQGLQLASHLDVPCRIFSERLRSGLVVTEIFATTPPIRDGEISHGFGLLGYDTPRKQLMVNRRSALE